MKNILVGKRRIGSAHPPFVIAELGYNFNTLREALDSVDAAAEAGVDAIKLQTFRADTVTTKKVRFPTEAGGGSQYQEFKQYEISEEVHRKVFARARKRGLIPFSTPSHPKDVELLERVGVDIYKIGSDDLTNLPYLRYIGKKGKPIIFSSGMATLAEVDDAVRTLLYSGNSRLVLLHCVSNYPLQDVSMLNLRVIQAYRQTFPILIGYSDHTTTLSAAIAAVAMGAVVIERHFALDKKMPAPDAFFSSDPKEMAELVCALRETHAMIGDGFKTPTPTEMQMRRDARKGLVALRPIKKGQKIRALDVIIKRPAHGILPRDLSIVLGRTARRGIDADEVISWDSI